MNRATARSIAGAAGILLGGVTADAFAVTGGNVVPERPTRQIPPVTWSAFLPAPEDTLVEIPVRSSILLSRWQGLRRALGAVDSVEAPVPVSPYAPVVAEWTPAPLVAGPSFPGESAEFQSRFATAWERAREDDAQGCLDALAAAEARTLDGQRAVARLRFAAAVSAGDLESAEALSYRIPVSDGGRMQARLEAWRRLLSGDGAGVETTLRPLADPTPGERGAMAMGRWQAGFQGSGPPGEDWMEAEGVARVALALAAGAQAAAAGDADGAARPLLGLRGASVPEPWQEPFRELSEPAGSSDPGRDDVAAYRDAAALFLDGRDDAAVVRLGEFLARWPNSTHRPPAYLLRAHLRAAAGQRSDAAADLQAVGRFAPSAEVLARSQVVRAFLLAQEGRHREARDLLETVLAEVRSGRSAGEFRFDRVRLLRLAGDGPGAEAAILELEESFPEEPWASRARGDGIPARWREPWRSLPAEPEARREIPAPRQGPWGQLLWGEFVLSREAESLGTGSSVPGSAVSYPVPAGTLAWHPPTGPTLGPTPPGKLGYLEVGLGAPVFGSLGGGLGGSTGGFLYRIEASQLFVQERNDLPEYRRTDWEIAGSRLRGPARLGVALEGTGRTDDDAPGLGLSPDVVDAYAWVARADLGSGDLAHSGFTASVSRLSGDVDADSTGRWKTTQTWFESNGALATETLHWDLRWRSASIDYSQPGGEDSPWFHDVRLVAENPGGFYVGGRAGIYRDRGLILPVAGIRGKLGPWGAWLRTEPRLELAGFRETFVANGDWNVPDFALPAERRTLDIEAGVEWRSREGRGLTARAAIFEVDELRTWRRDGPLWVEAGADDADGLEVRLHGSTRLGSFLISGNATARSVRADDVQVPYIPTLEWWAALEYRTRPWRVGTKLMGVDGRRDETDRRYGSFVRWDLEGAVEVRSPVFLLSDRIEIAARLENIAGAEDRRWPGVPGFGRGFYVGVRTLYGTPAGM